jgi:uncharacterized membrane protein
MATFLTLAQYRMYDDGDHMNGWGWGMGALMVVALVAVVLLVVWFVRSTNHQHTAAVPGPTSPVVDETPQQILDRRLAQGDITLDDYRERAAVLRGGS